MVLAGAIAVQLMLFAAANRYDVPSTPASADTGWMDVTSSAAAGPKVVAALATLPAAHEGRSVAALRRHPRGSQPGRPEQRRLRGHRRLVPDDQPVLPHDRPRGRRRVRRRRRGRHVQRQAGHGVGAGLGPRSERGEQRRPTADDRRSLLGAGAPAHAAGAELERRRALHQQGGPAHPWCRRAGRPARRSLHRHLRAHRPRSTRRGGPGRQCPRPADLAGAGGVTVLRRPARRRPENLRDHPQRVARRFAVHPAAGRVSMVVLALEQVCGSAAGHWPCSRRPGFHARP